MIVKRVNGLEEFYDRSAERQSAAIYFQQNEAHRALRRRLGEGPPNSGDCLRRVLEQRGSARRDQGQKRQRGREGRLGPARLKGARGRR